MTADDGAAELTFKAGSIVLCQGRAYRRLSVLGTLVYLSRRDPMRRESQGSSGPQQDCRHKQRGTKSSILAFRGSVAAQPLYELGIEH